MTDLVPITRAYTLAEIDQMRDDTRILCTRFGMYREADAAIVELQLRTYLMAGVDPAELKATAKVHADKLLAAYEQGQRDRRKHLEAFNAERTNTPTEPKRETKGLADRIAALRKAMKKPEN